MECILILGLGNDILSDDAIGPKLVKRLERDLIHKNYQFMNAAVGGLEIMELIKDFNQVIILDAIKTQQGRPGDIYHLTPDNFKETLHISSFHDVSFLTALTLAKQMNINLPKKIDIIAIEIVEDLLFCDEFSPPIKDKYEHIYRQVLGLISDILPDE
jgi:hydrogenase maturation protease